MIIARPPFSAIPSPTGSDGTSIVSWVKTCLSKLRQSVPPLSVVSVTAHYTATINDGTIEADATGGAITVTLPLPDQAKGYVVSVKRLNGGGNAVTIGATVDATVNPTLGAQWASMTVQSDGTRYLKLASI